MMYWNQRASTNSKSSSRQCLSRGPHRPQSLDVDCMKIGSGPWWPAPCPAPCPPSPCEWAAAPLSGDSEAFLELHLTRRRHGLRTTRNVQQLYKTTVLVRGRRR